jgi:hypothetical protein
MGANINHKNTRIMENNMCREIGKEEKLLNTVYAQLTEIYTLKGICLEILKDLKQREILEEKEQFWYDELSAILFDIEAI